MLDFTEAVIVEDTLLVEMDMRGGSLVMVTRPGVAADAGSLTVRYTDASGRRESAPHPLSHIATERLQGAYEARARCRP